MNTVTSSPAIWEGTKNLEHNLPSLTNNQSGIFLIKGERTVKDSKGSTTHNCHFVAIGNADTNGKFQLSYSEPYGRIKVGELTANPWKFQCVEVISTTTLTTRKGSDGRERSVTQRVTEHLSKEVNEGQFRVARAQQVDFLKKHGSSLPQRLAEVVQSIDTTSY